MDNIFLVESPLQALIALELSLKFSEQKNGIIFRLDGEGRERNDSQVYKVIERGNWDFKRSVSFKAAGTLAYHWNVRKFILSFRKEFSNSVRNIFFGEFRSQWMHLARLAVSPERSVLMDDGAATLIAKRQYIDHDVFYPRTLWASNNLAKVIVKAVIYQGLYNKSHIESPLFYASAFLKDESDYIIDFSFIRKKFSIARKINKKSQKYAYYFGSKYSEGRILNLDYELDFISYIKDYYAKKDLSLVYYAHRDESTEKLDFIKSILNVTVIIPDLPAELLVIENNEDISEVAAAYSSVLNNLNLILPEKKITSFRLDPEEINPKIKNNINEIYQYYEEMGILVEKPFKEILCSHTQ